MMDAWCEGHLARVLVTPSQIRGLRHTPEGIVVLFRCVCGAEGRQLLRSRRRDRAGSR